MAQSLETLRSSNITSLFGRRAGLQSDETLAGIKDVKRVVQDLTSASTGTTLNNYGIVNISGTSLLTSAQVFLLPAPIAGVEVTINNQRLNTTAGTSGSTVISIDRSTATHQIASSEASSGVAIQLNEAASVTLKGITSTLYQLTARSGVGVTVLGAT